MADRRASLPPAHTNLRDPADRIPLDREMREALAVLREIKRSDSKTQVYIGNLTTLVSESSTYHGKNGQLKNFNAILAHSAAADIRPLDSGE